MLVELDALLVVFVLNGFVKIHPKCLSGMQGSLSKESLFFFNLEKLIGVLMQF